MDHSIVLVGNGPSAKDNADQFNEINEDYKVARLNFFFLEEQMFYGRDVDYYFWAVNRKPLHDGLHKIASRGLYRFNEFYSPVPVTRMDYTQGKVRKDPFFATDKLYDHWRMIGNNDPLGRRMMSRPLPTLGVQALATFAVMGVKRVYLFGLDFYQSEGSRYAFNVPDDIAEQLGSTHTTPGYEAGAHSLEADLEFLQTILAEFPDLELINHTHFDGIDAMRRGKKAVPTLVMNQPPARPDMPEQATDAPAAPVVMAEPGVAVDTFNELRSRVSMLQTRLKAAEQKLGQRDMARSELDKLYRVIGLLGSDGLPHADVVWVVHEMHSFAGVYRPLKAYLEASNLKHHLRPKVIDLSDKNRRDVRMMIDHVASRPFRLVLNSVASFTDARVERLIAQAGQIGIYLHETDWTLSGYKQREPVGHQRFLDCVKRATVLCVSPAQAEYVEKTFSPMATKVVYNTVDTILPPETRGLAAMNRVERPKDQPLRIGMVGSFQPRKGTVLFSRVAKMAEGANMSFEWVGKHHEGHIDKSAIKFHGAKPPAETQKFIAGLDILFLPSQDDPQPLAALEAASRGVKIVCYNGIGTAEWIRDIGGCAVYDSYDPRPALAALQTALSTPLEHEKLDAVLRDRFDIDVFTERMKVALDEMLPADLMPGGTESDFRQAISRLKSRTMLDELSKVRELQEWEVAMDAIQRLKVRSDDLAAYSTLARRFMELGDMELADHVILAGIGNNPAKPSAKREAALYFLETDRPELAHGYAADAVALNPDSVAAKQILTRIEQQLNARAAE